MVGSHALRTVDQSGVGFAQAVGNGVVLYTFGLLFNSIGTISPNFVGKDRADGVQLIIIDK